MPPMFRMLVACCLAAVFAAPALALESAPVRSARAVVTLVTDTDAVSGQRFHAGLRFQLAPGWHTYWQNPGDAGVPAEIAWTLPPGAAAGPIAWPVPVRQAEGPLMTFAYTGEVLLPVTITPGPGPLSVQAHASWLVCERICVPEEGDFRLDLPAGTPGPSARAPLFAAAAARRPRPSPFAAHVAPDGRLALLGDGLSRATVADATFFPLDATALDHAAAQAVSVGDGAVTVALTPAAAFNSHADLGGVLVLRDPNGGETYLDVVATPGAVPAASSGLPTLLLAAVAGGLILNLMPCVFPILAMKAVALSRLSGAGRGAVRAQAAAYSAGVVLAFMALGGALLALRAGGSVAGWGFQFQSPVFVVGMAWLLFAVGLNLAGVFAVGGRLAGVGQGLAGSGGLGGSFFTGLLAVVVATPCTAPFMGAAIAGALAASPAVTLAVFAAMGVGLALPYAVLAVAPGLARALPRPGAWMDVLKQALAFPMFAAAVWLAWVAAQEAGSSAVLATLAGAVLLGFAAWALGLAQAASGAGRRIGQAAAVVAVAAMAMVLAQVSPTSAPVEVSADSEPFSIVRLTALRAEGHPVFVNMTAAWCVSCLVNERVALSPAPVRAAFAEHGVTTLKGDWTRQDPAISAFLRAHGRDGVPLYVFYAVGREGVVLPQILTAGTVLDVVNGVNS